MSWPPTVAKVRADLRRSSIQVPDADLTAFIDAAVQLLETGDGTHGGIGPHQGQSCVSVRRLARRTNLVLPWRAAEVTKVFVNDVEVDFDFDPNESARMVRGPFTPGRVRVEWTAPDVVPAFVERAATALAAHLWLQARPGAGGVAEGAASPMGYAVPNRVWQMVSGYALGSEEVS